ncbi:MAG: N-acetyl-gamma-glutamyl-phosphate reductase [Phycisphaerales bacterium]
MPVPVAILGPTGYTGLELIELLLGHPSMRVVYLGTAREKQPRIDVEFPRLAGRLGDVDAQCRAIDHDAIAGAGVRLAFLCVPHEAAMQHAGPLLARGVKVVDLSAAYRLKDAKVYERAYGHAHTDGANLAHAAYGLPELNRAAVAKATLTANPGCYPTAAALALVPLLRRGIIEEGSIIVNAASGASGAGREAKPHLTLVEAGGNFSAYGIGTHRHQPEIEQSVRVFGGGGGAGAKGEGAEHRLAERVGGTGGAGEPEGPGGPGGPGLLFVPHLLPIERGILETIYATSSVAYRTNDLLTELRDAYGGERFVVVRDEAPTLRDVRHTNQCHINVRAIGERLVLVAAIDNLVKGASGQAIQNANLMLGLEEAAGLQ